MGVAGGYMRFNPHANLNLGAFMTGTTLAWYTMPGWEVNYLWGGAGVAEMHPIALGATFSEYVVSGMTPDEILHFLNAKRDQIVKIAESTAGVVETMGAMSHAYADGTEMRAGGLQFTTLRAAFAEAEQPPTQYIRQGVLDLGGRISGIGGALKLMSEARETDFVYHNIGRAIGMKNTERLFENAGSKRNTIMLLLMLGGHAHTWGLPWADVPLVNGKTSFGIIADKLHGCKVSMFEPSTGFVMKKSVFHKFAKKGGFVGKAAKGLGAFI